MVGEEVERVTKMMFKVISEMHLRNNEGHVADQSAVATKHSPLKSVTAFGEMGSLMKIMWKGRDTSEITLNVTDYLYISTNVAKFFPQLVESNIIRNYRTCYPQELSVIHI